MNSHAQMNWRKVQQRQKEHVRAYRSEEEQYRERRHHLQRLQQLLTDHEDRWLEALQEDLGKPPVEGYASEIAVLLNELDHTLKHLKKWLAPVPSSRQLVTGTEKALVRRVPYGSMLVVSPWNYPLQLALMPVIGALAAGNSCFVKPSEQAPATSRLLSDLIGRYFHRDVLTVVEGEAETAQHLLELDWDFIFFTGSKRVGKLVHQQAAERTIPVALELGGKNPCIVDETGVTKEQVQRIVWGKFLNAGQSCIAPDTVYVHESVFPQFLKFAKQTLREFYGKNPAESDSYGRIVSDEHFDRLQRYLKEGRIFTGGRHSRNDRYMDPTILIDVEQDGKVQQEEIFGPVLPVIPYADLSVLLDWLEEKPSPLITYFFSEDKKRAQVVAQQTRSGAFSFNQVIYHAASPYLPFGGVGASGFGRYHGKASFDAFTYQKVEYTQRQLVNSTLHYPPYQTRHLKWLKKWRKRLF